MPQTSNSTTSFSVIFLGASTRAAATSARRAGWVPWCADLFADRDLQQLATVQSIPARDYPLGLLAALAQAPQAPVLYTGALENRPELLERLNRPLWGNGPQVVRAVRSPARWTQCLQAHGLPCPQIRQEPADYGEWVLKPRKSAGGFGLHRYRGQRFDTRTHFLQEWIEGMPCSAIFLGQDRDATLLGATLQLMNVPWLHAAGFHYAGSVGPLTLETGARTCWQQLGSALARDFDLRGLFGVDAILRGGLPWPVEINPRYTASMEILERSSKVALLQRHRAVFEAEAGTRTGAPAAFSQGKEPQEVWGKAILYARQKVTFPHDGPWLTALEQRTDLDRTAYADIPSAGALIERGRPVLSLFASAPTLDSCLARLQENALALDRCLWG